MRAATARLRGEEFPQGRRGLAGERWRRKLMWWSRRRGVSGKKAPLMGPRKMVTRHAAGLVIRDLAAAGARRHCELPRGRGGETLSNPGTSSERPIWRAQFPTPRRQMYAQTERVVASGAGCQFQFNEADELPRENCAYARRRNCKFAKWCGEFLGLPARSAEKPTVELKRMKLDLLTSLTF